MASQLDPAEIYRLLEWRIAQHLRLLSISGRKLRHLAGDASDEAKSWVDAVLGDLQLLRAVREVRARVRGAALRDVDPAEAVPPDAAIPS